MGIFGDVSGDHFRPSTKMKVEGVAMSCLISLMGIAVARHYSADSSMHVLKNIALLEGKNREDAKSRLVNASLKNVDCV